MFAPIHSPGVRKRFRVYDLEWYPHTYEVRLVGVYDGREYRAYRSVDEFLDAELNGHSSGEMLFAHAGGLADVQFVLERMLHDPFRGWEIQAAFSGSSAIIVKACRGKHSWMFGDSFWLLRDKLSKIGESIGMAKGGGDSYACPGATFQKSAKGGEEVFIGSCGHERGMCMFYAPFGVLRDYNEQDCRILWHAIEALQTELLSLGGELMMTIAGCAMRLFRGAFLKTEIATSDELNEIAREAYIASRVEVIRPEIVDAHYYDVNSSFPFSMTKPQPGSPIGIRSSWDEKNELALVRAKVSVPPMYIPPIPYRAGNRVYFPVGAWTGWFSGVDLQLLLESGGRIEKVWRAHDFAPFDDMRGYVDTLYEMRRKEADGSFRKLLLKYLLNSLYGKTGETSEKDMLIAGRKPKKSEMRDVREIAPGVYFGVRDAELKHAHVPIAMNITASSRALLTRWLREGARGSHKAAYCDTDSIVTTRDDLPNSDRLGDLKYEKSVTRGEFFAPKMYRVSGLKPNGKPYSEVRAKGFSRIKPGQFEEVVTGGAFRTVRMLRVREVLTSGDLRPREKEIEKYMRRVERPKREFTSDGDTRPWDVAELKEDA